MFAKIAASHWKVGLWKAKFAVGEPARLAVREKTEQGDESWSEEGVGCAS